MPSCSAATAAGKDIPSTEDLVSDIAAAPIDPKKTTSYRLLLAVVIFLGALIVIALGVLVVGLVTRFPGHGGSSGEASTFVLAPGARIVSMDAEPNRLILRIRNVGGEEIDIIDTDNGRLVGQVKAAAHK
jgi:TRAP-type mannitol/chloroaromatic compound transport system permease large subunit